MALRENKDRTEDGLRKQLEAVFRSTFYRDILADVAVYLQASPSMLAAHVEHQARCKGFITDGRDIDSVAVMPGALYQRMIGYRDVLKAAAVERGFAREFSCLVNLGQTVGFHQITDLAPALLTRSTLCQLMVSPPEDFEPPQNIKIKVRSVLPVEHFCIMSLPISIGALASPSMHDDHDVVDSDRLRAWHDRYFPWESKFMNSLEPEEIKHFTGNGMNLEAVATVVAFALAFFTKKSVVVDPVHISGDARASPDSTGSASSEHKGVKKPRTV